MTTTALPEYLVPERSENGSRLNLDFDTYRMLARTAIFITHDLSSAFMGIYRYLAQTIRPMAGDA
jgi:hypothetical protein